MTHNIGEFEKLLKMYVFGPRSEYSFVLDLLTGAPHDCYEYTEVWHGPCQKGGAP